MDAELIGAAVAEELHRVAAFEHRCAFAQERFQLDRLHLGAVLFRLAALLGDLIVVKLALDPFAGAVEDVGEVPEQVFKVGLEPGVDECRDHRVEDIDDGAGGGTGIRERSEEHTSELQSLMRISYAVFCLKKKKQNKSTHESQKTHS